jgi:hypothetical protein
MKGTALHGSHAGDTPHTKAHLTIARSESTHLLPMNFHSLRRRRKKKTKKKKKKRRRRRRRKRTERGRQDLNPNLPTSIITHPNFTKKKKKKKISFTFIRTTPR